MTEPVSNAAAHGADAHPAPGRKPTLLVLTQVFIPDPASVGQHIADATIEMARRGYRVIVYTANHGYENAASEYPAHETIQGVEVRRLPFASFGKKHIVARILGTVSYMTQAFFAALFTPSIDGIFFSTSPPLIGFVAALAGMLRVVPIAYWAMDLNPDQLIAMGKLGPRSLIAGVLGGIDRFILRRAAVVIALDRFMAERIRARIRHQEKLLVMPPWPHENHIQAGEQPVPDANPFRQKHGLVGKFVIMYSGNHSPANPLDTFLKAMVSFKTHPTLRFLFVGGGSEKEKVEATIRTHGVTSALSLPNQPLEQIRYSLSAADVHVVSLGENMVGIVHPCKIYGAIAIARPVLYFGPRPSHITDLLDKHRFGWHVAHGDVDGAVRAIEGILATPAAELAAMGQNGQTLLRQGLSQSQLTAKFCDAVETHLDLRNAPA